MNADVEAFDDGFFVRPSTLRGAAIQTFGDHRIAMAFGVAGLLAEGETVIDDAGCVEVSFPGFFQVLESVSLR
jgi:3-phosphoshikimate 1-carboxyvinyltransferase